MNLLMDLRSEFNLTYIFISHNLAVVEHIATAGRGDVPGKNRRVRPGGARFSAEPRHPYTQALLASVLTPEPGLGIPDMGLGLSFPDPVNPPAGCPFHPRCSHAMPVCAQQRRRCCRRGRYTWPAIFIPPGAPPIAHRGLVTPLKAD